MANPKIKRIKINNVIRDVYDIDAWHGNPKEAYLDWGGRNLNGSISPVDAAMSAVHSANRLAFGKAEGIGIEYSTDGGTSWNDYGANDNDKTKLTSDLNGNFYIGKKSGKATINDKLRITLNAQTMEVYTRPKKLLLNISTNGASKAKVLVEWATLGAQTNFSAQGTYDISGWSGWNSIPLTKYGTFGGSASQTSNGCVIRLTFSIEGISSSYNSNLSVMNIGLYGDTYWTTPSIMAKNGQIYTYNVTQDAIFPHYVIAPWFKTTSNNHLSSIPSKIVVQDNSGYWYHRTLDEIKSDLGIASEVGVTWETF